MKKKHVGGVLFFAGIFTKEKGAADVKLCELDTPVERHKIMKYGTDGISVVRRFFDMQHIDGILYKGVPYNDGYGGKQYDIYLVFPDTECGLVFAKGLDDQPQYNRYHTSERIKRQVEDSGCSSPRRFAERCRRLMEDGCFIGNVDIEFVRQFDAEFAEQCAAYRAERKARQEYAIALRRAKAEAEDAEFVRQKNAEFEAEINKAVASIRQDACAKIENSCLTFYHSRWSSTTYSLVNVLCRRYGVSVPLRTQGWINGKLLSFSVAGGEYQSCRYQPKKRGEKPSQSIHKCLKELVAAVRYAEK